MYGLLVSSHSIVNMIHHVNEKSVDPDQLDQDLHRFQKRVNNFVNFGKVITEVQL